MLYLDVFWICIFYVFVFKVVQYILLEKTEIIKILFNVDIKYGFSENNPYRLFHFVSGCLVLLLCSIKPIINSVIYFVVYRFVDITEVNYILLLMSCVRVMQCWDGWVYRHNWYVWFQFGYTILNYSNIESITPATFQLVDEMFDVELFVKEMENIYKNLISLEVPGVFLNILTFCKVYDMELHVLRIILLSTVGLYSFVYTDLYMTSEFLFYYFVVFRVIQLGMEKKINFRRSYFLF